MAIAQLPELCELLDAAIAEHDLTKHRDALFANAQPCVLLCQGAGGSADFPVGATRIGGLPDLPASAVWPSYDGKMLPFIAQLDLSTLPRYAGNPLPSAGWLYFFCSATDEVFPMPTSVFWCDGEKEPLDRRASPDEGDMLADWSDEAVYGPVPVVDAKLSVSLAVDELLNSRKLKRKEQDRLFQLVDSLNPSDRHDDRGGVAGQVLGLMNFPDGSPMDAVEDGEQDGDDWTLLLEVQSVGSMLWSDSGMLDFSIRRSCLDCRDFSNVYSAVYSS